MPDPTAPGATKPTVRLLLHLARTGGTIMSKCLAVMPKVALLSEIHPAGLRSFNPMRQAFEWHGLLSTQDVEEFRRSGRMSFPDAIGLVLRRAEAKGMKLVIRDWNHLDFHGAPYVAAPTRTLMTSDMLAARFHLLRFATVRHPIDQWLSLIKLPPFAATASVEAFCDGCAGFAEHAVKIGFVRYEDFTREPAVEMQKICTALGVEFDPTFQRRWQSYTKITGDTTGSRGGKDKIVPLTRKPTEPALLEKFDKCASYHRANALLGYGHPE